MDALEARVDSFFMDRYDENKRATPRDPLHVPVGPITRARAKRFK